MTQEKLDTIKLIVLALAVWSVALLVTPQPELTATNDDKVVWLDNYEAALKEAKATGKPIFLEFRCAP